MYEIIVFDLAIYGRGTINHQNRVLQARMYLCGGRKGGDPFFLVSYNHENMYEIIFIALISYFKLIA